MADYRRYYVAGGTFFFTVKTARNVPLFRHDANARLLGSVLREMKQRWPVEVLAMVLMPDHLHTIWTLPADDADYPKRWGWVKKEFTKQYLAQGGREQACSESKERNRRRGVWQRRYWEHMIRDEADLEAHFDYIHWNPVKHRYVQRVADWPYSTFHRWVRGGHYPADWGTGGSMPALVGLVADAGE